MASKRTIVFQGEPGANSDLACRKVYPAHKPVPCPTFEDAFAAVRLGHADLAMIPIENSVAGRVADIHHLVPHEGKHYASRGVGARATTGSTLHIVGEYFMPVHHQLMALRNTKLEKIRTVESHVHALGQCRKILRALRVKPVVAADTAGSAREVSESGDPTRAAIATDLAAKTYGLKILKRNIEDEAHNTTRFIMLSRNPKWPKPNGKGGKNRIVTTFVFQVRNIPAALYKALGGFATNGINMTKLESYMVGGSFSATQFYADVEGHPKDRALELALEELDFVSQPGTLKILGVYPGHKYRNTFDGS